MKRQKCSRECSLLPIRPAEGYSTVSSNSDQLNLYDRKAEWEALGRTLEEGGANDLLITETEFTLTLSELGKDTLVGPH